MIRSTDDNLFEDDNQTTDADRFAYDGRDTEAGLQAHRHYDPTIGRWINEDPIGFEDGANLYRYVGDAPCNDSDPTVE